MGKLLPYFKWFPSDAESDEKYAAMNISERGLFHSALNYSWINDGLPVDASEISRVLRVPARDFMKAWPRVALCFVGVERLRNPRQEQERTGAITLSKERARAGLEGGKRKANAKQLLEVCLPLADIRAYNYESKSVFESSEEKRKGSLVKTLIHGLEVEEMEKAHERHLKQRAGHTLQFAAQLVITQGGKFDLIRFRDRHSRYCAYWDKKDWQFCPLTLCEWIENGMPEPPAEAKAGKPEPAWMRED